MINVVWFKRDLRWEDHQPLFEAIRTELPTICFFSIEPDLIKSVHYSNRHWKFMLECIRELRSKFNACKRPFYLLEGDVISILNAIYEEHGEFRLFSHMETGIAVTYERDKAVQQWCREREVQWLEFQQQAVQRGRKNRKEWTQSWNRFMYAPIRKIDLTELKVAELSKSVLERFSPRFEVKAEHERMQRGGRSVGLAYLQSFLRKRHVNYSWHISKPAQSRTSCSRLSPYLAWGAISIREVVQMTVEQLEKSRYKRNLANFKSRLHWHCHFIQKLESEPAIEFCNQNRAFDQIRYTLNDNYLEQWKTGRTGIPLVDACMRCLNATGYINFRMRAMLVSFWTHHLMQPWQPAADHLSQQFLDFEPGIHFAQIQMQAGTVGYHTLRTYNPTKQALEHDPSAEFIKKWVPELEGLASYHAIEPWSLTAMEEMMYDFKLGVAYPKPICDIEEAGRYARDTLHKVKKSKSARHFAQKISDIHVNK